MKKAYRTVIARLNAGGFLRRAAGTRTYAIVMPGGVFHPVPERIVDEMFQLGLLTIVMRHSAVVIRPAAQYEKLSDAGAVAL